MAMTLLDPGQVVKTVYDGDKEAIKVSQIGGSLVPELYDTITLTYVAAGNGAGEIQTVTYCWLSIDCICPEHQCSSQ